MVFWRGEEEGRERGHGEVAAVDANKSLIIIARMRDENNSLI